MFAYGSLSVILALYLTQLGLSEVKIGLLLTFTLLGDTAISLWITTNADRVGRRWMLIAGALLMTLAAGLFTATRDFYVLLLAATIGVISPGGNEVGPFLSIEQASLTQQVTDGERTRVFARYNLAGSFATALGALSGGGLSAQLQALGYPPLASYQAVFLGYGLIGLLLVGLFVRLSHGIEISPEVHSAPAGRPGPARFLGLGHSRRIVFRLAALFSLDAFAGGFIIQSLMTLWFNHRFGVDPGLLGAIFFGANMLAGISALSAVWIARRIGLIHTMVFTHLPSNALLILVPFMPTLGLAIGLLLMRFSILQMDVPTRQSYIMAVVAPGERSAASGITGVARTVGAAISPVITGAFLSDPARIGLPFIVSGGLKILCDLALYANFRVVKPPEEQAR